LEPALPVEAERSAARLVGRQSECEALDQLVDDVLGGRSRVVVLRGDAGVGKSALLGYLSDRGGDWHAATAVGVESELELAYSGLHQLCAPMLDHLERLPIPQRDALATVFGRSTGPAPDRLLVGLATLTLFAEVSEKQPLLCIVDDAEWLDHASAQILGFVARRLLAERVALVFAARTGVGDEILTELPTLSIGGLDDSNARELLLHNVYGPLDAAVCDQIVAESHGNPLALLELPRTWDAAELAGGFGLPDSQPAGGRIEQSYARRLLLLPADTQLLVLVAAAEPSGDTLLLHAAAETLGIDIAAVDPAVDAGLIEVRGRVEFAHPLVRSAAYRAATVDDRYRVHRAIADATDPEAEPDRRAWHRARGTPGPDEAVAAELERSAGRAQSRGGLAAAAAFLTRAAELTPEPTRRVHRALDAALANVQAGAFDAARRLLTIARSGQIDELQRARIELVRAQLAFTSKRGNEATPLLLAAARRLEPVDVGLARETYLDAFMAALLGARLNHGLDVIDVAQAARAAPHRTNDEATCGELLLDAFSALTDDYATAMEPCRAALRNLCGDETAAAHKPLWLWQGTFVALELWDDESWHVLSDRHLQIVRKTGALSELPVAVTSRSFASVFFGELAGAASLIEELRSFQEAAGIGTPPYGAVMHTAWEGRAEDAKELIQATIRDARSRGEGIGVAVSEYAEAVLCNGSGRYDDALLAARRAAEDEPQGAAENWALTELIESATRTGRPDLATEALTRLARKARASGTDWALGIEARSRALLSKNDAAEGLFREAIEHLSRTRVRAELARAYLLYGEWLRRANRRVDARGALNVAYEMFNAMGVEGFAERTRRELSATGTTVHKRNVQTRDDLTAQEAQIARLARDGLSNPEIGAQLFISARTVEWHLRKVFTKLGISSRRQLRSTFSEQGRPSAGVDTPAQRSGSAT
jgi:DNA-binding CsgD family transcriptional regulator